MDSLPALDERQSSGDKMDSGDTTFYTASSGLSETELSPSTATLLTNHSSSLYED